MYHVIFRSGLLLPTDGIHACPQITTQLHDYWNGDL